MALERNDIIEMAKVAARSSDSSPVAYSFNGKNYTNEDINDTLRAELNELAGTPQLWRENKNTVFTIIEEVINDVLPARAEKAYEAFAEVKTFGQGEKPVFRRKKSARNRAKQFITKVGLAGRYEVFKLGGTESFEVPTNAVGGAAQIGFEEFLDGRVDFAEIINVVMDGMDEIVYKEVERAMIDGINQLPQVNHYAANGFNEHEFDKLLTIASAYGVPTIYCTYEFAAHMIPQEAWRYTEGMKQELWNEGRLTKYKKYNVIIMPQGFEDETNSYKDVDPSYCWIIPTGVDGKPVKIAFEGATQTKESDNDDWSKDIQVYRKVGVVAMFNNGMCSYRDTSLARNTWNLNAYAGVKNTVTLDGTPNVSATISGTPNVNVANTTAAPVPTKEVTE